MLPILNSAGASFLPVESVASRYWIPSLYRDPKPKGDLTLKFTPNFSCRGDSWGAPLIHMLFFSMPTETKTTFTGFFSSGLPPPHAAAPKAAAAHSKNRATIMLCLFILVLLVRGILLFHGAGQAALDTDGHHDFP